MLAFLVIFLAFLKTKKKQGNEDQGMEKNSYPENKRWEKSQMLANFPQFAFFDSTLTSEDFGWFPH